MGKNKNIPNYSRDPEFAPKTLQDHPFYGLTLDPEQEIFRDAIWNPEKTVTICDSIAGSGKTLVALGTANLLVQYGFYDGIVYIMFPTQEQRQGYLPGTLEEKSAPYMQPLLDAMATLGIPEYTLISDDMKYRKEDSAYITFTVDTFLRGCNLENKVVIVDEIQNGYFPEIKKVLTRIHDNCCTVLIGSHIQSDLFKHVERSGFIPYINAFQKEIDDKGPHAQNIAIVELKTNHRGWFSNFCDLVPMPYKL